MTEWLCLMPSAVPPRPRCKTQCPSCAMSAAGHVADAAVAVCLPCWRRGVSMTDVPPQVPGYPEETCVLCGRRTTHGIYLREVELPDPEATR